MSDNKRKHVTETHSGAAPLPAPRQGFIPWPPLIFICAIAISIILNAIYPLPWLWSPLSDILVAVGWLVLLAVVALLFSAIRTMTRAKTTLNPNAQPDHFVTNGPFAITRNPMYLANALLLIGLGLVAGIAWFIPMALVAGFLTQKIAIEKEERWLAEKFGKRYRDYAKRVRRWI